MGHFGNELSRLWGTQFVFLEGLRVRKPPRKVGISYTSQSPPGVFFSESGGEIKNKVAKKSIFESS